MLLVKRGHIYAKCARLYSTLRKKNEVCHEVSVTSEVFECLAWQLQGLVKQVFFFQELLGTQLLHVDIF